MKKTTRNTMTIAHKRTQNQLKKCRWLSYKRTFAGELRHAHKVINPHIKVKGVDGTLFADGIVYGGRQNDIIRFVKTHCTNAIRATAQNRQYLNGKYRIYNLSDSRGNYIGYFTVN